MALTKITDKQVTYKQGGTGSVVRNLGDKIRETVSVKDFGAVGDGVTDDTDAIQAAIDASTDAEVFLPVGTYIHTGLTIASNMVIRGESPIGSILKLKSSTNADCITIEKDILGLRPVIQSVTIDGNSANNLTNGRGIYLPSSTETDANIWYGQSLVLRDVYIQNTRDECLYAGVNRNMGTVINTEFKRGSKCVYIESSADWRFLEGRFGFPQTSHALEIISSADCVFVSCAFFGAISAVCVKVYSPASSPTKFIGCTINYNQQGAMHLQGFSGASRHLPHVVSGCWFAENSLVTDGGYSHIKLENISGVILSGNCFRYTGTGNKPNYLVEFSGASFCEWNGNSYDATINVPFTVAETNDAAYLLSKSQTLRVLGHSYLGGESGAESLFVPPGVAGGNRLSTIGRASGTSPDLLATGTDTNIGLRISSKGTGTVEILFNNIGLRIARFLAVASSVNYLDFYPAVTGSPVQIVSSGSDTDIDLRLACKGAGVLRFGTYSASADVACNGYITVKDSGGTVRKLMTTA